METRAFVFICILFAVFVVNRVSSQVGELCRPNERFLSCGGCQKTCKDPAPSCAGVCRVGCYCDDDEVRNETGHCVKLADCPPLPLAYKEETIEPHRAAACPPNEEYRFCEPCNKTCDNPNPICPAQCARGCFCKDNLLRDLDGKCVEYKKCSNLSQKTMKNESTNYINLMLPPLPYELICGQRQVYNACGTCEKTCSNPKPQCTTQCIRGCFCQHGLVRAPSGDCVELEKCPKGL